MNLTFSLSPKRLFCTAALGALAFVLGLLFAVPPLWCAAAALCVAAAGLVRVRIAGRRAWWGLALLGGAAALLTVLLVQIANETIRLVPAWKLLLGALCVLVPMLALALPLSFLPKNGGRIAIGLTSGLLLILGVLRERLKTKTAPDPFSGLLMLYFFGVHPGSASSHKTDDFQFVAFLQYG